MPTNPNRRKVLSIALGACFLVLFAALATLNAFNKGFRIPRTSSRSSCYWPVGGGVSALRCRAGPAGPQHAQALRRPAQPRHGSASAHADAVGRGTGQLPSHRLHVRLQLSADEPRRRPLVLAAGDADARRQQPHGAWRSPSTPRPMPAPRRTPLRRLSPKQLPSLEPKHAAGPDRLQIAARGQPAPAPQAALSRRQRRHRVATAMPLPASCASMRSRCRTDSPSSTAMATR